MTNNNVNLEVENSISKKEDKKTKNNFTYLLLARIKEIKHKKGAIASFATCLGLIIVIDIAMLCVLLAGTSNFMLVMGMQILNAAFVVVYTVISVESIFGKEVQQNVASLELREGYSPREIFGVRIIEFLVEGIIFFITVIAVNLIMVGAAGKMDEGLWYKFFVSSLGWYSIMFCIAAGVTYFFCSFGGVMFSSIIGVLLPLILIIVPIFAGIVGMQSSGNDSKWNPRQAAQNMLEQSHKTRYEDLAKNVFHIEIPKQGQDYLFDDNNDGGMSLLKLYIDNDFLNNVYHSFITNQNESDVRRQNYSLWAYVLSFGPDSIKEGVNTLPLFLGSNEMKNFYYDVDNYFKNSNFNYDYKLIDFFDDPKYDSASGDNVLTPEKEPLVAVADKMEKSSLMKKWKPAIDTFKMFSDQRMLDNSNLDFGQSYHQFDAPFNTNIFSPTWLMPRGWARTWDMTTEMSDSNWVGVKNFVKEHRVNPAEIMFFKNFFLNFDLEINQKFNLAPPSEPMPNYASETALSMIYNPLTQFALMLNGVDYKDPYITELSSISPLMMSSQITVNGFVNDDGVYQLHREAYTEILYICYFVFNALLIWASYGIFKKKIKL